MDLGSCPKHHALALRADYEKALSRGKDYDYDLDAMEHLTNFIAGKVDYAWTQKLCFQETYCFVIRISYLFFPISLFRLRSEDRAGKGHPLGVFDYKETE